jgi:hypothetical protein
MKIVNQQNIIYNEDWSSLIGCYLKPNWYYNIKEVGSYYNSTFHKNNHPLIRKGLAFWDNNQLVIGYNLKNNPDIFRPLWCKKREKEYHKVRIEINMYSKFSAADSREKMVYNILLNHKNIKKIPEVILRKISKLTYDPYLLD